MYNCLKNDINQISKEIRQIQKDVQAEKEKHACQKGNLKAWTESLNVVCITIQPSPRKAESSSQTDIVRTEAIEIVLPESISVKLSKSVEGQEINYFKLTDSVNWPKEFHKLRKKKYKIVPFKTTSLELLDHKQPNSSTPRFCEGTWLTSCLTFQVPFGYQKLFTSNT